tara:strand:- start:162 stop:485 length:324 start_codon:yes stop_codon:yes gene_type:complete
MKFSYQLLLPLIGLIICETFSQFSLEKMIKTNNYIWLGLGAFGYMLVSFLYYLFLKSGQKIAVANVIWNIGTTICVFLIGTFYFKETLSHRQLFGIVLAICAGVLLQ